MARTVFLGGRVFDGSGLAGADVVIDGDRILDVGRGLDGDVAVDVAGASVLPGLFDCHVHTVLDGISPFQAMQRPFSYQFFLAARNLRTLLNLGITTVRDAGGADAGIRRALADKLIAGPRLQISVSMISQTGGHGDPVMPSGLPGSMFSAPHPGRPGGVADGPADLQLKAREMIRAGADVLKVATSGGVLSPDTNPRHGHYRAEELAALVAEAEAAGIPVMAHAQATAGIKEAIRAGVRSIEHGIFLDDEAVSMMVERGTWLVPTLVAPRGGARGDRRRCRHCRRQQAQDPRGRAGARRVVPTGRRRRRTRGDGHRCAGHGIRPQPGRALAHDGVQRDDPSRRSTRSVLQRGLAGSARGAWIRAAR